MEEMEEKLGIKVGKGKVDPEVLRVFEEMVAPVVLPRVVRGIMKGVFELDAIGAESLFKTLDMSFCPCNQRRGEWGLLAIPVHPADTRP